MVLKKDEIREGVEGEEMEPRNKKYQCSGCTELCAITTGGTTPTPDIVEQQKCIVALDRSHKKVKWRWIE